MVSKYFEMRHEQLSQFVFFFYTASISVVLNLIVLALTQRFDFAEPEMVEGNYYFNAETKSAYCYCGMGIPWENNQQLDSYF